MGKDYAEQIAAARKLRKDLADRAGYNANDIGTADYVANMIGAKPVPGQVIAWVLSAQPESVYTLAQEISVLKDPVLWAKRGNPPAEVQKLFDGDSSGRSKSRGWGGDGGNAFENRWTDTFLPAAGDVIDALDIQVSALEKLAEGFMNLQRTCRDSIRDHLYGFNAKYEQAVKTDDYAEWKHDVKTVALSTLNIAGDAVKVAKKDISGVSSGIQDVLNLLSVFQNNVADTAKETVRPLLAEAKSAAGKGTTTATEFHVEAETDFTPLGWGQGTYDPGDRARGWRQD